MIDSRKKQTFAIGIFCLLLFISSCRKVVESDFPDFQKTPTINGILVEKSPVRVHLSFTQKIDNTPIACSDSSNVQLFVNNVFRETLSYIGNGIYESSTIAEAQNLYRCEVLLPNLPTATAATDIPQKSVLTNVKHHNKAGQDEEGLTYPSIQFTFKNQLNTKQYFEVVIRLITPNGERRAEIIAVQDPVLIREGLPIAVFHNSFIKDSTCTMTLNYNTGNAGSTGGVMQMSLYPIILELRSVSMDYYHYARQLYLYNKGRDPHVIGGTAHVFPLYSNIENGYGIFASYSAVFSDTIYPNRVSR